jgi:pimeloyl-ACP methyl ester carboxylesterase
MTIVLLHGVPDTAAVWDAVRSHLTTTEDVVALSLPGFGSELPEGFDSTKEAYLDWVITELERFGEPVHLVGHDWGALLATRIASLRQDLIRTWSIANGPVDPGYEWHPLAQLWATPGAGEEFMNGTDVEGFAGNFKALDVPAEDARAKAERMDDRMKDSILKLYRSSTEVSAEWGPDVRNAAPGGLIFWGRKDQLCPVDFAYRMGAAAGAEEVRTLDANHWVILEQPQQVAELLEQHWARHTA